MAVLPGPRGACPIGRFRNPCGRPLVLQLSRAWTAPGRGPNSAASRTRGRRHPGRGSRGKFRVAGAEAGARRARSPRPPVGPEEGSEREDGAPRERRAAAPRQPLPCTPRDPASAMKLHRTPVLGFFRGSRAQAPDREGVLLQKGARRSSYQRRWFVLRGNLLFYLQDRADRTPLGLILVEDCRVEPRLGAAEPYAFTLRTPRADGAGGRRAHKLAAESPQELGAWLGALAAASWRRRAALLPRLEAQYRALCQAAGHEPGSPPGHPDFLASPRPPSTFQDLHERFGKEIRGLQAEAADPQELNSG